MLALGFLRLGQVRFDALALRDIKHRIVAEERNALGFAAGLVVSVQPFPEHHGASFLAALDAPAQFLGLVEREPERALV